MPQPAYALIDRSEQWTDHCDLQGTAIGEDGALTLAWQAPLEPQPAAPLPEAAGLAIDGWCRVIRSEPATGRVTSAVVGQAVADEAVDCSGHGPMRCPTGLAVDRGRRLLYVADTGSARVHLIDLVANRTLRTIPVRSRAHRQRRPVDVAAGCEDVWVLVSRPDGLVRLRGRRGPLHHPGLVRPAAARSGWSARRIEVACDQVLVLWRSRSGASLVATAEGEVVIHAAGTCRTHDGRGCDRSLLRGATDLALADGGATLVVAGGPDRPFQRFVVADGYRQIEPLDAPGYDGTGIAVSPDGEVAFRSEYGLRWALTSAAEYRPNGRTITYRLDAGRYQNRWGRLFLDACIPDGTSVRVGFVTTDDDDVDDPVGGPPAPGAPPTAPAHLLEAAKAAGPVFRRGDSEQAYHRNDLESVAVTYETPVDAPAGRYLWVNLELSGTRRTAPRIEALRVEQAGHPLVQMLPAAWSREQGDADFLFRFLAPLAGMVTDYDLQGELRHALLDPRSAPAEYLDWLAGFVGLVFDQRWPERARRLAIAEASRLFARRGTLAVTERFLEIYLGYRVPIVEQWRLRGLGGGLLGAPADSGAAPIVGRGSRLAGTLGNLRLGSGSGPVDGNQDDDGRGDRDGFETNAHRFLVLVPTKLGDEQRSVVELLLDSHRPAHTIYELCEMADGMRVGRRLHVGLTSVAGPATVWAPLTLGRRGQSDATTLGGGDVSAVGSRLGFGTTGRMRVA